MKLWQICFKDYNNRDAMAFVQAPTYNEALQILITEYPDVYVYQYQQHSSNIIRVK